MFTKEEAKEIVRKIVERFEYHLDEYKKGNYNETQTRNDFINPFFEALGWDINNRQGLAESYREVIHEDKIKIGGHTKAPDYCFTIYGQRKFFLEAKKPSVSITDSIDPAYQLRRYGWSAKMPISIITDFEELSIYDCTIKPTLNDKASVARINYFTYRDYLKEFDFLWDTFSKEMVLKGSFDKFVSSNKGKRGTSEVDKELLKLIEGWRSDLAKNIALRNNEIDIYNLNLAVQKIIDRIIFLRIAEDKGIEPYELLFSIAQNKDASYTKYKQLDEIFIKANKKYNAGLFQPEKWLSDLKIDDKVIVSIINALYYPECPYEFSILPIEILGNIYEQFLGKTIQFRNVKDGHTVIIDEKPEVRKAGGVYYTPQYIVNYIVKNTVGKILGDWESGIGNQELGNRNWEIGNYVYKNKGLQNERESQDLQGVTGLGRCNEISRNDLLLNEDSTQTGNLRTNQSDSESSSINSGEYIEFNNKGKYAPNMESNSESKQTIKRNDSLAKQEQSQFLIPNSRFLSPVEISKIKICDPACGSGSFLVGAYQYLLNFHLNYYTNEKNLKSALKENKIYQVAEHNYKLTIEEKQRILINNIFGVDIDPQATQVTKLSLYLKLLENEGKEAEGVLFRHSDLKLLPTLENNIKCGNSLIGSDFYNDKDIMLFGNEEMRKINVFDWEKEFPEIFKNGGFDVVIGNPPYVRIHLLDKIYVNYFLEKYKVAISQVDLYSIFIEKSIIILKDNGYFSFITPRFLQFNLDSRKVRELLLDFDIESITEVGKAFEQASTECIVFNIKKSKSNNHTVRIFDFYPMQNCRFIKNLNQTIFTEFPSSIFNTVISDNEFKLIKKLIFQSNPLRTIAKTKRGMEIGKKTIRENSIGQKTLLGEEVNKFIIKYQNTYCLETDKEIKRLQDFSEIEKLLIRRVANKLIATYDNNNYYFIKNLYAVISPNINLFFLLALINSQLINFFFKKYFTTKKEEIFPEIQTYQIESLPIRVLDFSNPAEKAQHDRLVSLVDSMLEIQKQYHTATTEADKKLFKQKIDILDHRIDTLVYQLYGLTEEEIRIVEGE